LLISLLSGAHLRSMWGSAFWSYVGLALVLFFEANPRPLAWRRFGWAWTAATLLMLSALVTRNWAAPYLTGHASRIHFPGEAVAASVDQMWKQRIPTTVPVVAGPWWFTGNYGLYGDAQTQLYGEFDTTVSPWTNDEELRQRGGIVIWEDGKDRLPDDFLQRFPSAQRLPTTEIPYLTQAAIPPLRMAAYFVPPADVSITVAMKPPVNINPLRDSNPPVADILIGEKIDGSLRR
jgi:hypothetical protein